MRYEYTITDHEEKKETVKAMSWKKALKKVLMLHPKFNGSITYINKKGNDQVRIFREGKQFHGGGGLSNTKTPSEFAEIFTQCVICGHTPKPDEWSPRVKNCCIDCG